MPREHNLRKDLPKNKPSKKLTTSKANYAPASHQAKQPLVHTESYKHQHVQQLILNAFGNSFFRHADSFTLIQELKQHLFNRDFLSAFGRQDLLEVYALRWSPSRALAYFDLFRDCEVLTDALEDLFVERVAQRRKSSLQIMPIGGSDEVSPRNSPRVELNMPKSEDNVKVTCLGAGSGAEVVSFAAYLHWLRNGTSEDGSTGPENHESLPIKVLNLQIIDMADWSAVVDTLVSEMTFKADKSGMPQSPLTDSSYFQASFSQLDVLSPDFEPLTLKIQSSSLVTLMFTLNELYTTSMSRTTTLLLTLTSIMEPGSFLLVVDSPGSYSTVKLSKRSEAAGKTTESTTAEEKRYPMQWLLDHTLIEASNVGSSKNASGEKQWEKVHTQNSRWCRLPKGLTYPIELEDMRYQVHLYKKL